MTAVAVARRRPPAPVRPRLLLPPIAEPRGAGPDPREIVLRHPVTRSVLAPPVDEPWAVPGAQAPSTAPADPTPLAGAVVLAAVEALSGSRPLVQLTRWVTPQVYEQLSARAPLQPPRHRRRATVRSTRVARLSPRVAEATVVLHDGERVRAAAARLEVHRRAWRVTVLQIG
ncbi:Rv3235 family protein [Actinotalea sp. M2MS4P-6]|uniref:Rv3235 family protein n=1 Tax=Actinotalea sp. M2MS4P-6 TaxID=2983762 RepID=UPI0021E475A2|nr:Rv3235 family protein [Actinotalea sp. M2MS4P-6]MCV2394138.1 Rv3235 family protein [Actinotalea sp. M2MS4P-6]